MAYLWLKKYQPTQLNDFINNNKIIIEIDDWIKNYNNEEFSSCIVCGSHGIGKTTIVKLILELNNYYFDWLSYSDSKSLDHFDDIENNNSRINNRNFFINDKKKYALVIDDIEKITLKREKKRILELTKRNINNKNFPIIFISNIHHNKLINDIKKISLCYNLFNPNIDEMKILFNKIIKNENININCNKTIKKIIKNSQNDTRRLLLILYDLKLTFNDELITYNNYNFFFKNTQIKDKDISLFDATIQLYKKYKNISQCNKYYNVDKVLIPLTLYENYYLILFNKTNKNQINKLKKISTSFSYGDIVETIIYTEQKWHLHNIHSFYSCINTTFLLNKNITTKNNITKKNIKFSSDLNQTSIKNINKKNFFNLQKIFKKYSLQDILQINNIIYKLLEKNDIDKIYQLLKSYDVKLPVLETILKIDKSKEKIVLTHKNKRYFNILIKHSK